MKRRLSLRARFVLGLGAVLLPFLLAAAVGFFYLLPRLVEPLEDIVREVTEEMHPVTRLQTALLMAAMPVNDYLIHGDSSERARFAQARRRVEQAFAEAAPERFTLAQERALIESAHKEWAQALRLGEALLRLHRPVGDPAAARAMQRFDAHIDRAVGHLQQAHGFFSRMIDENRAAADIARTRSIQITFGAFVLASVASLFAAALLARSILVPVQKLEGAAVRFGAGDLAHRVAPLADDELGRLAETFNAMAGALERSRAALVEISVRDGLTGLYNHREFHRRLGEEIERARRYNRPVSLLMLDIDRFKNVNDTHGHLAGDEVLRALAGIVRQALRPADQPARYGGEEFAVILPETPVAGAVTLAERLRAAVAAGAVALASGQTLSVTVSIGVAAFPDAATDEALVAAADRALYAAKQGGRNRVCRYEPGMAGEKTPA